MPRGPRVIQILRDFSILGSNIIDEIDSKINIKIYIPFVTLLMEGKIYSNFSDTCILTSVLSIIRTTFDFYILKKSCLYMTPICDQSFKINRTEVNRVIEEVNDSVSMFTVQNPNTQTFFTV